MYKNPFEKGRLIISFNVEFPKKGDIDLKKVAELEKILPPKSRVDIPMESEEHMLIDIDPAAEKNKQRFYGEDVEEGGPKRVQCANQ